MTKPSAGNTGRHEDSILWDRLRADLNNLGAAYGVLPEPQGPLTPFGEALQSLSHGLAGAATSQRRDSEPVEIKAGEPISHPTTRKGYTIASETDRNLYYDGIILAARKKREKKYGSLIYDPMSDNGHEWSWSTEACAHCGLTGTYIVEHGDVKCDGGKARAKSLSLSNAFASPPSFPKRIGWKPGDCE